MSRWEPNALERLQKAAYELYTERGYDQTTVAEIAARAGLTERTFFRHFADKREVLFGGSDALRELLEAAVTAAPPSTTPIDAVANALIAASSLFHNRGRQVQQRHAVINANSELQERELIKLASLASAMADALRARGVGDTAATLTADAGIAVFRIAFERWVAGKTKADLATLIQESLDELKQVTAGA